MDTYQKIEAHLNALLTNSKPVVDDSVYLFNATSFAKSPDTGCSVSSSSIDTRHVTRLSIVCGNATSTNMQIVVSGFNTPNGTIPVIITTMNLNTIITSSGCLIKDLFPYTKVTVTNLDVVNAGVVTVTYVTTR